MTALMTDALGETLPQPHARAAEAGPAADLLQALAQPLPGAPSAALQALGARLAARVADHAQANAALLTQRRPRQRLPAQTWSGGARAWALRPNSWLVELPPETLLQAPPEAGALELVLLSGALETLQERGGHALLPAQAMPRAGTAGALLYLRRHGADGPFHAPAQALWQPNPAAWQPLRAGVQICPLHGEGAAVSLLARFEAGGRVPAHPHGIAEECLMLEGELFLADVLLRAGEYQYAPGGSQHGELFADAPCLLFFHGAIDPAAIDNAHRQARGWPAL